MPRRNHKGRTRRHRPTPMTDPVREERPDTDAMARDLVKRGLASPQILHSRRFAIAPETAPKERAR